MENFNNTIDVRTDLADRNETVCESCNSTNCPDVPTLTITEETTLGELIEMLQLGEKPCKTPTPRKLQMTEGAPVVQNDNIAVYKNGFVVYGTETGTTVIWLPECKKFTYCFEYSTINFDPDGIKATETLPTNLLSNLAWMIPITLVGDHRVEMLSYRRKGDRKGCKTLIRGDNEEGDALEDLEANEESLRKEYRWDDERYGENPLNYVLRKERQMELLQLMTEKQREVFVLYYIQGYNQYEISQMLGIVRKAVGDRLEGAIKKVKKFSEEF